MSVSALSLVCTLLVTGQSTSDHSEKVKWKGDSANLDCLFFLSSSSVANMCTVPWSLDTHRREESWLKLMLDGAGKKHRVDFCSVHFGPKYCDQKRDNSIP